MDMLRRWMLALVAGFVVLPIASALALVPEIKKHAQVDIRYHARSSGYSMNTEPSN